MLHGTSAPSDVSAAASSEREENSDR